MTCTRARLWPVVASAAVLLVGLSAFSARADEEIDRTPKSCVLVNSVDGNTAADDRTVVFYMHGKTIYRNDLPASCSLLRRGETNITYKYRTQSAKLTRLCDYDKISVGRASGECKLGTFKPITATEAASLLGEAPPAAAAPPAAPAASAPAADDGGKRRRGDRGK